MMRRTTFMVALAALAAARPALADGKPITLGAAVQMTGALANTGRYYRDAYQLTVERINSRNS